MSSKENNIQDHIHSREGREEYEKNIESSILTLGVKRIKVKSNKQTKKLKWKKKNSTENKNTRKREKETQEISRERNQVKQNKKEVQGIVKKEICKR